MERGFVVGRVCVLLAWNSFKCVICICSNEAGESGEWDLFYFIQRGLMLVDLTKYIILSAFQKATHMGMRLEFIETSCTLLTRHWHVEVIVVH